MGHAGQWSITHSRAFMVVYDIVLPFLPHKYPLVAYLIPFIMRVALINYSSAQWKSQVAEPQSRSWPVHAGKTYVGDASFFRDSSVFRDVLFSQTPCLSLTPHIFKKRDHQHDVITRHMFTGASLFSAPPLFADIIFVDASSSQAPHIPRLYMFRDA